MPGTEVHPNNHKRLSLVRSMRRRLAATGDLRQTLINIVWLAGDKVLGIGIATFVGVWMARVLGPVAFGSYSFALAWVGLIGVIASLGIDSLVLRDLVHGAERHFTILGTLAAMRLGAAAIALAVIIGLLQIIPPATTTDRDLTLICALSMLFRPTEVIDIWFQSRVRARPAVIARTVSTLLSALLRIWLITQHSALVLFGVVFVLEAALSAIGLIIAYRVDGQPISVWRFQLTYARQLLREGWPLILGAVSVIIYMRIDQIMIGQLLDTEAVGVYAVASRFSELGYFVPMIIMSSLMPSMIAARSQSAAIYTRMLRRTAALMIAAALCLTIPMSLLSTWVVTLVFGTPYAAAGPILALHIWSTPFVFLGVMQSSWDVLEGTTGYGLVRTGIGALTNIALNFILIPAIGGIGAALATLAAQMCAAWIVNAFSPRTRALFWLQARTLSLFDPIRLLLRNEL